MPFEIRILLLNASPHTSRASSGLIINYPEVVPTFDIRSSPDHSFTTHIVAKSSGFIVGVVNMNGIVLEILSREKGVWAITSVGSPRFIPTHFKPYTMGGGKFSSIGH